MLKQWLAEGRRIDGDAGLFHDLKVKDEAGLGDAELFGKRWEGFVGEGQRVLTGDGVKTAARLGADAGRPGFVDDARQALERSVEILERRWLEGGRLL